jgi:hypothetical protein
LRLNGDKGASLSGQGQKKACKEQVITIEIKVADFLLSLPLFDSAHHFLTANIYQFFDKYLVETKGP